MTSKVIQGHIIPLSFQIILAHSFMNKMSFYVIEKFSDILPSDLKTTLTYVPMDNFCPCFLNSGENISTKHIKR